jgi:purine-binding chemotaxis protein CheW
MTNLVIAERGDGTELTAGDEEQLVTMVVDDQLFGIPILRVQDIVEPTQITPVPCAPSAIAGVLNLRGRIVTVIDLRECLGAPPASNEDRLMSVTVEHDGDLFTLLVDSIGDVRSLPRASFDKPPVTLDQRMRRLCSGVFRLEGQLLALLDVEKVLDDEFIASMPLRTRPRLLLGKPAPGSEAASGDKGTKKLDAKKTDDKSGTGKSGTGKSGTAKDADGKADGKKSSEKASAAPKNERPSAAPSLYDRLGGEAAIDAAVDLFYDKVMDDDRLTPFFEGRGMAMQGKSMKAFLGQAFGGPKNYKGRDMRKAHQKLVHDQGLDDSHFIAVAGHLSDTLAQMGVPDDLIHEVLSAAEGLREEILDR